jgi:guanylate kinase
LSKTDVGHIVGELLEKATRILTPEERVIFDMDWIGKDGSKRKLEVRLMSSESHSNEELNRNIADYGQTKTEEVIPVRSQMAGP